MRLRTTSARPSSSVWPGAVTGTGSASAFLLKRLIGAAGLSCLRGSSGLSGGGPRAGGGGGGRRRGAGVLAGCHGGRWDGGQDAADDVVGRDVVGERVVGQHQPVAQDVGRDVLQVL